jgi:DeoR family transcriptional regulator, suf operon transcriptional repressor
MPVSPSGRGRPAREGQVSAVASLLGKTRASILSALCGRSLTAQQLAEQFAISSNAIRAHLGALRNAQLVRYRSERRGVGKPTHVFELTPLAEYLLSRAYAPALSHVLRAARAYLNGDLEEMLRAAGRDLAWQAGQASKGGDLQTRVDACVALLGSLGGSPRLEEQRGAIHLRSDCCPLASVVADQPVVCKLLEGVAREILGREVEERCDRTHAPHCLFVVPTTG